MVFWLPVSLVVALLAQSATPTVASSPSFTGTWRLDPSRSESAATSDSAESLFVEIRQTERDLTIVTTQGQRRNQVVHNFVKSAASPFSVDGGSAGRAYWEGAALVTEGTRLVQGQTVATRETRTLNEAGTEMTVQVVVIVQHGYEFRGARNYGMGKDVYTRAEK